MTDDDCVAQSFSRRLTERQRGSKAMTKRGFYGILSVLALSACSGSAIDVGPGGAGAPAASGANGSSGATGGPRSSCTSETPLPIWPPANPACASSSDSPLIGSWQGYAENQPAPWDEIFLEISGVSSDGLCGTLKVGNVALPSVIDPDQVYPPHTQASYIPRLVPGAAMTLQNGTTDGTRVRFTAYINEAYKDWCELQTSYQGQVGMCTCVPAWASSFSSSGNEQCTSRDPNSGATLTFACGKATMCTNAGGACICNSSGCAAEVNNPWDFDLRITGDMIKGGIRGGTGAPEEFHVGTVHFTRSP